MTINEAISHKELLDEIATLHNEVLLPARRWSRSAEAADYQQGFRGVRMLTEEQAAAGYAEATEGCRHSLVGTRDNARQWQRVKPDPETNALADLDCEKVPTWDQRVPQATPLRASTCAGS